MKIRKTELEKEEVNSEKELKALADNKNKLETEVTKIEFRYSNALSEVIGKLNYWLTYRIDDESRRVCVPALEYLNEQLLMLDA